MRLRRDWVFLMMATIHCALTAGTAKAGAAERALATLRQSDAGLVRSVLDNGMVCLLKRDASAPVVSVQIWVGTGSIHEQEWLGGGLCHAIEHMIFKGTVRRKPGDITREINDAGGDINAYTSLDRTVFHADLPSREWRVGLDVLADAVMNASFPEDEWTREKEVILREYAMNDDDPDRVVGKLLWRTAFTVHPYRFPVIGYREIFTRLTRNDLVAFCRRHYVPDNMIVVIVGDIDPAEVEAEIRKTFESFERRGRAPLVLPTEPPQLAPRETRKTGPYHVGRLEWSCHTVPTSHPDAPALDILAQIAGDGRSSRLVRKLKDQDQLAHSISAWSYTPREPGLFGISAVFDPAKEQPLLDAIRREAASWATTRFTRAEIDKARRMVLAEELATLQTMKGQASGYAEGEFYANDPRFASTYLRALDQVTAARLREVAQRYLRPENQSLAVLSPANRDPASVSGETATTPTHPAVRIDTPIGIPVILREDHRLPMLYLCVALRGGVLSEPATSAGMTKLMSELLVKGTSSRSKTDIATEIESLGGHLNPFSGLNSFGLQARCLVEDADRFMALMADCLLHSTFPADELDRQRRVQLAAIDEDRERPFSIAQETLRDLLFPNHPYRFHPLGRKDTVAAVARPQLVEHFRRHVVSSNLVLAVFGDLTPAQARSLVGKHWKGIPAGCSPLPVCAPPTLQLPARSKRREPREQAVLLAGFPGVRVGDPRADALTALQYSLSGLSSDLAVAVRDKRGLAYYVGAYQQLGIEPGAFVLYAGTREEAAAEVEKLFHDEIKRITTRGLRAEELDRARRQLIADHEMGLQDNLSMATSAALDELYGLGFQHAFTARERFAALTVDDVREAAASVLATNREALAVVLPAVPPRTSEENIP